MQKETIIHSRQMMTVIIEHMRLLSRYLKQHSGPTYNEFCVLLALYETGEPETILALSDFTVLQKDTVTGMLIRMEDAGLVARVCSAADRRIVRNAVTEKGSAFVRETVAGMLDLKEKAFLPALPNIDNHEDMGIYVHETNSIMRGHEARGFDKLPFSNIGLSADYLVYWRELTSRWAELTQSEGRISLAEYRILELLVELGSSSPKDIAENLILKRSNVSLYKGNLLAAGLIREAPDPFDGRGVILRNTRSGKQLANKLHESLNRVTQFAHRNLPTESIATLNVWYMQMYYNMRNYLRETHESS